MGYPFVSGQPKHLDAGVNAARTTRAKVLFARGKNAQQRRGLAFGSVAARKPYACGKVVPPPPQPVMLVSTPKRGRATGFFPATSAIPAAGHKHGLDRQTTGKRAAAERSEARSGVKRRKR